MGQGICGSDSKPFRPCTSKAGLAAAEAEIGRPAQTLSLTVDVRDYAQVIAARDAAVERFGRIDILICCAGGAETRLLRDQVPALKQAKTFHEVPIEVYDFGIDLNLKGPIYFAHAVMAQMAKQMSGVIIFLGSITGVEGGGSSGVAYACAKSGLITGATKSLAQYGAKYNIRVNCISPGPVLTREAMARMSTLMGRAAEPQEIVDMILYIASDKAAFMTGSNILIDGGRNVMDKRKYEK